MKTLDLTNFLLNFHDEILLWSTTTEGESRVVPRLYLEFRPDDIFNTNPTAWWNTGSQFNRNCDIVRCVKGDCEGS